MSQTTASQVRAEDPVASIERALRRAAAEVLNLEAGSIDPHVRPAQNPQFGDFQANLAMPLAKQAGLKPRDLAQQLVDAAADDLAAVVEPPEVAGPGFINLRLKPDVLAAAVESIDNNRLGIEPDPQASPIAIDLCGVNVAKQMHVGHLRSTIIGDGLARVFERRGRTVLRQNHLGDWGLPIAMVLHQLRAAGVDLDRLELTDLDRAYRDAQLAGKADSKGLEAADRLHAGPHRVAELEAQNASAAEAMEAARMTLVKLQQGDPELVADWQKLIDCTMRAVEEMLELLNVHMTAEHNRGESFYRDRLADVVDAFVREGISEEDEGALVVRFDDRDRPLLIRKSDGGFLYATTDLAAVRYRTQELGASRVIYVVDARQRDHFRDVFDAARRIGWDVTPDGTPVELVHVPFGAVLGTDKRPLKTRSGENVTLMSLLNEAVERGTSEVKRRAADPEAPTHDMTADELDAIGRAVGIGAVKYADMSNDLVRDYVFDMDRMIAFEGNTGPYIQYAHARINSIFQRGGIDPAALADGPLMMTEPAEKQLALALLRYGATIEQVASTLEPHRLCSYLYELANTYSAFYQQCPVLKAEREDVRMSRLRLCDLTRRVIADGLDLLGIDAPPRM